MVNVNTQVSSSMELPFGEYTLMFLSTCLGGFSEKRSSVAAACFFFLFCGLRSSRLAPELVWITTDSEWKYHRHLYLAFSHGCNPGGVSEIWRLLKRPWKPGLMVMMVQSL